MDSDDTSFMAVGADELGIKIQKGDYVTNGDAEGLVHYYIDENGKETDLLCFIKASPHDYLVGIRGQALKGVRILKKKSEKEN